MHPGGIVAVVMARLKAADLIPPIKGIEAQGPEDDEYALVTAPEPVTDELRARVSAALAGLPHELREVSPGYGVTYAAR